ncbi:MAG TPA: FlgD immunoglobulin-like domain containing protein [Bacteroidota bacterium]|nr:FlgD immunoglobulin-like domain containing protein [Bacteroidota bacterium]
MKQGSHTRWIVLACAAVAFAYAAKETAHSLMSESLDARKTFVQIKAEKEKAEEDDPYQRISFDALRYGDPATGVIPADMRKKEVAFASVLPTREQENRLLQKNGNAADVISPQWMHRGPVNVGGRTRALAVDVANNNTILAGGVSGGMWRSTNGGAQWVKTTAPDELQSATCIVQDTRPGKTSTWYYGTGELVGNSASRGGAAYRGDGVFKSTDNGASWTRLQSTATYRPEVFNAPWDYVWRLAIDRSTSSSDIVYAATIGAIMRSTDGGTTWSVVLGSTDATAPRFTDVAVDAVSGAVYASMSDLNTNLAPGALQAGLWRSPDGVRWTKITPPGFPVSSFKRFVIAIAPSRPSDVFFLGETPGYGTNGHSLWKYTYVSGDGSGTGGVWENRSANLPNQAGINGKFDSQGSYDLVCAVKPDDPQSVFIGGINLYRSTSAFTDTVATVRIGGYASASSYAQYLNNHPDHHALAFDPVDPKVLLNGNDGGVYRTQNATASKVSWTPLNNGYFNSQFYTVSIDHATLSNTIIGGSQDNGTWMTRSLYTDVPWTDVFGGDGAYCAIASSSSSFYVSSQNGNAYRIIVDQSNTVTDYVNITPTGGAGFLFINPFYLDPNNLARMYLCGGNILWRNNDITKIPTYTQSKSTADSPTMIGWDSLRSTRTYTSNITAAAVSTTPANIVYYATSDGKVFRIDNANSGDPAPVDVSTGKGLPSPGFINGLAINPQNAANVMVVYSNYNIQSLFITTDGGKSWTPVGGTLEQNPDGSGNGPSTRCAAIIPMGDRTFYLVGTSVGLFSATQLDGQSTRWIHEGETTIGSLPVDMIDWRANDKTVVVATHGGGIFSGTITTGSARLPVDIPRTFLLQPNFPNPFNPDTHLRYTIPERGRVHLTIYDGAGRLVAGLIDADQDAGTYEIRWDGQTGSGERAASGVYYARLEQGGKSQTTKMILQR